MNNNCATGATAIHIAHGLVAGGMNDCVLAVGFEKMEKGYDYHIFSKKKQYILPLDFFLLLDH